MYSKPLRVFSACLVAASLSLPATALAGAPVVSPSAPASPSGSGSGSSLVPIKFERDAAIAAAKKTFTIPDGLGEPNASIYQSNLRAVWNLNWQTPRDKPNPITISVEVDATTGLVTGYRKYGSSSDQAPPLTYTRNEAYKLAADWLDKLVQEQKSSLHYADNPTGYGFYWGGGDYGYPFHWERMESSYPVQGDGVTIAVDARTGELTQFNLSWRPDLKFTAAENSMTREQAEAVYRTLPMRLQYQQINRPGTDKQEWRLMYQPVTGYPTISSDGKLLGQDGTPLDTAALTELTVVPASDTPYTAPAKPLSRDEALALGRALTGQTGEPSSSNYSEYGDQHKSKAWDFSWSQPSSDPKAGNGSYFNVRIDAEKGVTVGYNHWVNQAGPREPQDPKLTLKDATAKAVEFFRTHRPDLAGKAAVMPDIWQKMHSPGIKVMSYNIQFTELSNGIPLMGRQSSVSVDAQTGDITGFWSNQPWNDSDQVPAPVVHASGTDAVSVFLKLQGLQLAWVTFRPIYSPAPIKQEPQPQPQQLLWGPGNSLPLMGIDADTGAPLDYQGRNLNEVVQRPTDIEGHFAQREIELLWARGIFELQSGKFNPSKTITVAEAARWLVQVRGLQPFAGYNFKGAVPAGAAMQLAASDAAPYFGAAMQAGILTADDLTGDLDLAAPISREMFALLAVRAMGYGRIAKMPSRIDMPFADKNVIGDKYYNAVAILYGLGVVKGSDGYFHPQGTISRGEAAKLLFAVSAESHR